MGGIQRYYDIFTPLQRVVILGVLTAVWSVMFGTWAILGAFILGVSLSRVVARHLVSNGTCVKASYVLRTIDFIDSFVTKAKSVLYQDDKYTSVEVLNKKTADSVAKPRVHTTSPEEEARLMVQFICGDFIKTWYHIVSDDETFVEETQELLEKLTLKIFQRMKVVNVEGIIQIIIRFYHRHLSDYQESFIHWNSQPVFRKKFSPNRSHVKKLKDVTDAFKGFGKFHIAMQKDSDLQLLYLRSVMDILMKVIVPDKIYECLGAKELLQEILACNVLMGILNLASDPSWLHQAIILITSEEDLVDEGDYVSTCKPEVAGSGINSDIHSCSDSESGCKSVPSTVDKSLLQGIDLEVPHYLSDEHECPQLMTVSDVKPAHLSFQINHSDQPDDSNSNQLDSESVSNVDRLINSPILCVDHEATDLKLGSSAVSIDPQNPVKELPDTSISHAPGLKLNIEQSASTRYCTDMLEDGSQNETTTFLPNTSTPGTVQRSPSNSYVVEPQRLSPGSPLLFKVFSEGLCENTRVSTYAADRNTLQFPSLEEGHVSVSGTEGKGQADEQDKSELEAKVDVTLDQNKSVICNSSASSAVQNMFVSPELGKYFHIQNTESGGQKLVAIPASPQHVERQDVYLSDTVKIDSLGTAGSTSGIELYVDNLASASVTHDHIPTDEGQTSVLHSTDLEQDQGTFHGNNNFDRGSLADDRDVSGEEHLKGVTFKPSFFLGADDDTASIFSDVSVSSGGSTDSRTLRGNRLSPEGSSLYLSSPDLFQPSKGKLSPYGDSSVSTGTASSSREHSPEPSTCSHLAKAGSPTLGSSPVAKVTKKALNTRRHSDPLISRNGAEIPMISGSSPPAYNEVSRNEHDEPDCLFTDITIPNTETLREPGGGGSYTIYIIQYTAWHKQLPSKQWVQQAGSVKRRYREFVTLQDRLEEHSLYRKSMKNIKGPRKWPSLPMSRLESKKVESRRVFLQKYLQALSEKANLSHSMALREFMAYEGDARLAYVRKAPEMPRLDRVIVRTFSGMFNKISSALPGVHDETQPTLPKTERQGQRNRKKKGPPVLTEWKDPHDFKIDFEIIHEIEKGDVRTLENVLVQMVCAYQNQCDSPEESDSSSPESESQEFQDAIEEGLLIPPPRSAGDGSDGSGTRHGNSDNIPLALCVLDLAVQTAQDCDAWVCQERVLHIFRTVAGKALEQWLRENIADLTTSERCAHYIHLLRETLWPNGILDSSPTSVKSEREKEDIRKQARDSLIKFLPGVLPVVVGHDVFGHCIDQLMASLDHPQLNRHFGFCILDIILEALVPEVQTAQLQHDLLMQHNKYTTKEDFH